jgi:predicted metallopeptidase
MAVEYNRAPGSVRIVVKKIRRKHYPEFKKAKIVVLMRSGNWNKYGTIRRVSKQMRASGIDGDYILTLHGEKWGQLSEKQRRALVDHELYHMVKQKKKNREGKIRIQWKLRHHDIEEFGAIVKRYGLWEPGLVMFAKAMRGAK